MAIRPIQDALTQIALRLRGLATCGTWQGTFPLKVLLFALLAAHLATGSAAAVNYPRYADMGSQAAIALAERVLSWQLDSGGWGKNLPILEQAWEPGRPRSDQVRDGVDLGSFDNGATTSEMRYLAAVYSATGEPRYKAAFERGLDFILAAQYPSGGWPQTHPRRGNYSDYVTFNDDAMVRVMELVRDVYEGRPPFDFVSEEYIPRLRRAFDLGVEYILNAQIQIDGVLTGWCQQHDPVTYVPRPGRPYEHVSISGSETVGIVRLLMSLPDPSDRIRASILGALLWLDQARLPDGRWARFYEIGTNRPIFSGRDGVIKYDIMQIEAERRDGYAWFGTWPSGLLAEVSRGYIRELYESLPHFPVPHLHVSLPIASGAARTVSGNLPIEVVVLPGGADIERITVSLSGLVLYDGPAFADGNADAPNAFTMRFDVDTLELPDGWSDLVVEATYAAAGGGEILRTLRFAERIQVRNRWTLSISMRPPQDQGWFGIVDHLRTSARSDGWEFLTGESDRFHGDPDRIAWGGTGIGYLEWEAPRLIEARLVAYLESDRASLRMWVSPDREHWNELDIVEEIEPGEGKARRIVMSARAQSSDVRWFRVEVAPSQSLQLGQLDLVGLEEAAVGNAP